MMLQPGVLPLIACCRLGKGFNVLGARKGKDNTEETRIDRP